MTAALPGVPQAKQSTFKKIIILHPKTLHMKNLTAIIALLFCCGISYCQKGPKIDFTAEENTMDYGRIARGDRETRIFEFTNTGDSPLLIRSAETPSGNLAVTPPSGAIMPGKKGSIRVQCKSMPSGPIRKTITVETNAVNYPQGRLALKIKGEVL